MHMACTRTCTYIGIGEGGVTGLLLGNGRIQVFADVLPTRRTCSMSRKYLKYDSQLIKHYYRIFRWGEGGTGGVKP